ncbi:hypothetical protein EVAR_100554_1 [Eumeta japonica]|uniref:Uncharacterized protein n=1 Tax=Eumeta variegata TaxID=151549 RepID=A0A4C2A384_EUMVA|nr:hypothetical protein EVAR_100554_1 [Eumeta japonica]
MKVRRFVKGPAEMLRPAPGVGTCSTFNTSPRVDKGARFYCAQIASAAYLPCNRVLPSYILMISPKFRRVCVRRLHHKFGSFAGVDIECVPLYFLLKDFAGNPNLVPDFNSDPSTVRNFDSGHPLDSKLGPTLGFDTGGNKYTIRRTAYVKTKRLYSVRCLMSTRYPLPAHSARRR